MDNPALQGQSTPVIASFAFCNFKALRSTRIALTPFNLVIGPNGSGKTSLLEAVGRLGGLARMSADTIPEVDPSVGMPEIDFAFSEPYSDISVRLSCVSDLTCNSLAVRPVNSAGWPALRAELGSIRSYVLDHEAIGGGAGSDDGGKLHANGANLAAVLARLKERSPQSYSELTAEVLRIMPEFRSLELAEHADGRVSFGLRLSENGFVPAVELSQGMLYLLAILALAFDPDPPRVICIEEVDRGIHPRALREVRDALYRLSFPRAHGLDRRAVQVVTTTHSPYFIDLFNEHPEDVIISQKRGRAAHFERLSDRPDLPDLLREGSLGDMWFSGILGGVPPER